VNDASAAYIASLLPPFCTTPRSEPRQKPSARELWRRLTRVFRKAIGRRPWAMNHHTPAATTTTWARPRQPRSRSGRDRVVIVPFVSSPEGQELPFIANKLHSVHHFPHWVDRAAAGRQAGFHREGQTRGFHSCRKTPSGTSGPNCLGGSYAANSPPARIADQLQPVANLDDRVRRVALHDSNGAQAGFSRFRTDRRSIAWSPSLRRAGIGLRLRFVCAMRKSTVQRAACDCW